MNPAITATRRQFLQRASGGFGALALAGLWNELQAAPTDTVLQRRLLERDVVLLQKPFTAASLAAKVREALDRT